MVFSDEDKILIKSLYQVKGYKVMELMNEFSNKWWTKVSINRLLIPAQSVDFHIAVDYGVPH